MDDIVIERPALRSAAARAAAPAYTTLVELLEQRAAQQPGRRAYSFLRADDSATIHWRCDELAQQARRIAARLQREFRRGDRVLLTYAAAHEFVPAFFGCLYAGVVPVLAAPPTGSSEVARLQRIADDADAVGLCTGTVGFNVRHLAQSLPSLHRQLRCLEIGAAAELPPARDWSAPWIRPDDAAFLQYTSGTTGAPKGVLVSHANVVDNQRVIERAFGTGTRTRPLGWLPPHHDMGLIGHVVHPLHLGVTSVLMPAAAFVASPVRWLQAISDQRATVSGGPNYAFELCIRRVTGDQLRTLDLSGWEVAYSGSEMVRPETMERFAEKFAACGFRREAFVSCYGLAEATLLVAASPRGRFPATAVVADGGADGARRGGRSVVSCGEAEAQRLAVVDPASGTRCADGGVGEVWIRGASVCAGYDGGDDESAFGLQIEGEEGGVAGSGWFRTGDLGFLRDGELFVTGRSAERVELGGRCFHPVEIEDAVRGSHPALHDGAAAAFTVAAQGRDQLVVVQEMQRREWRRLPHAEVERAAQRAVRTQVGVRLQRVLLLPEGSLPKTAGGKLRRGAAREAYMSCEWPSTRLLARQATGGLRGRR